MKLFKNVYVNIIYSIILIRDFSTKNVSAFIFYNNFLYYLQLHYKYVFRAIFSAHLN